MARISITTTDGVLIEQFDSDDYSLSEDTARALLLAEIRAAIGRAESLEGIRPEVFSSAMAQAGYCGVQTAPAPKSGAVMCGQALPCETHGRDGTPETEPTAPPTLTPVCAVRAYNPATREDVMCGQPLPCPEPEHGIPAGQFVQAAWRADGVGDDGAWPTWATPELYADRRRADFERERNGNWPAPEAPTGGWISGGCA